MRRRASQIGVPETRPPPQKGLEKIKPSTPINVPELGKALKKHPNRCFVNYLITGLVQGFLAGLIWLPKMSFFCKNLQSALKEPEVVDTLLEKEITKGFMIGPFDKSPFSTTRINPIGIATRKYSGKKRLIIDLSAPHNDETKSINSLIPPALFSLCYATTDDAIKLIQKAGRGAWLAKADITDAFKVMPLHPSQWHLFGVKWREKIYFSVRFTFGCRSSPKIFDTLSEALCWILLNNCKLPFVLHLLDDLLLIDHPNSKPENLFFFCDNEATVNIINKGRSSVPFINRFVRRLTWLSVLGNFIIRAAHIPGVDNTIADSLSRFEFQRFRQLCPEAAPSSLPCPPFSQTVLD